jgi:transketolase
MKAAQKLFEEGITARVVSMPCMDVFEEQDEAYKQSVLPDAKDKRVVVEAAASFGWHKYAGKNGEVIALDHFGASAPANKLYEVFGLTAENVAQKAIATLAK